MLLYRINLQYYNIDLEKIKNIEDIRSAANTKEAWISWLKPQEALIRIFGTTKGLANSNVVSELPALLIATYGLKDLSAFNALVEALDELLADPANSRYTDAVERSLSVLGIRVDTINAAPHRLCWVIPDR